MKTVLIVEDDPDIVELLKMHLSDMGCSLSTTYDGERGLDLAMAKPYDLVILDLMLPGKDGMEICRQMRMNQIHTPVMMLTAKSEEIDKVLGLEMGADDYLTKPFSIRELMARVKAIFRRSELNEQKLQASAGTQYLEYGDLSIDLDKRKVSLRNRRVELSPKEFELLSLLASNPGKSYDRARLLNLVWGYDFDGFEHTVNSHINRLRSKIETELSNPQYILTTWGVGYRFNEEI